VQTAKTRDELQGMVKLAALQLRQTLDKEVDPAAAPA
jgi:hypothetical protein